MFGGSVALTIADQGEMRREKAISKLSTGLLQVLRGRRKKGQVEK